MYTCSDGACDCRSNVSDSLTDNDRRSYNRLTDNDRRSYVSDGACDCRSYNRLTDNDHFSHTPTDTLAHAHTDGGTDATTTTLPPLNLRGVPLRVCE